MKPWLVILILVALLIMAGAGATIVWMQMSEAVISTPGLIALALGAGLSILLGAGLMALVYYSSRKGYDDTDR